MELRQALEHKTKLVLSLQEQVEQQKLLLSAAQREQQAAAAAEEEEMKRVKMIVEEIESGEWARSSAANLAKSVTGSPSFGAKDKTLPSTPQGSSRKHVEGGAAGLDIFSPDMAPGMRARARSEVPGDEGSPGGTPLEADDFQITCVSADSASHVSLSLSTDTEHSHARAVSVAGSADDARSEVSACESEVSYCSASGSVRSLNSNFSEASVSTAMSQAGTTQASGGSRADREEARRLRAAKRVAKSSKSSSSSLFGLRLEDADKENSANGAVKSASASARPRQQVIYAGESTWGRARRWPRTDEVARLVN